MTANHNVDAASFCPSTSSGPSPICCVSGSPRRSCQPGSDGTEDVGAGAHQADIDPRQPVTAWAQGSGHPSTPPQPETVARSPPWTRTTVGG